MNGVPPDVRDIEAAKTYDEETGEIIDHLAGLYDGGLLGAQVWVASHKEIGKDGEMHTVYKGGTVVWYDEETVTVVTLERRYGKPSARVDRIEYKDIVPEQNIPATAGQRYKLARHICATVSARKGAFEPWERRLIGFAAALANR